ncbi:MAG: biotin/lipoyl-binding protein, partial [Planctomycetes bacterium]|nr:biotin/lipoyl-binding protein [Planctomycetota bacterium]
MRSAAETSSSAPDRVPPPRRRWWTRVVLPIALITATAALLVGVAWASLFPGVEIEVIPVMVKTVEARTGSATVVASGWLEPDPYPYYATTLVDGIVEEVLVLEGDRVTKGQVIARLVGDDAQLSLERARAELAILRAEEEQALAEKNAEHRVYDTLIDRHEAQDVSLARVVEIDAELEQLESELDAARTEIEVLDDERDRKSAL